MSSLIHIALIGNPNTGKTSLFNALTGLNQHVGNYPGVTVDKKIGTINLPNNIKAQIIDLPGTYSINASSLDEDVAIKILKDKTSEHYPNIVVVVAEVENLKRNLLLFTQVQDLGIPSILVINMKDQMEKKGIQIDVSALEKHLKAKVVLISTKTNEGIATLKALLANYETILPSKSFYSNKNSVLVVDSEKKQNHRDTVQRYQFINKVLSKSYHVNIKQAKGMRAKLDAILMHRVWGYVIFFFILFNIFQALFTWSSYPMELIDGFFVSLSEWVKATLSPGVFTSLLSEGVIPGLGGIVIFIPQIAFLFLFLSILEETGYMSRVVFLMDKIMRKFGLSGKSVVPLISGTACAIPAIMATRNMENWKERLITILVTPFTTCSARLPVYAVIVGLVISNEQSFMGINNQAIVLMMLYILGFVSAIVSAYILNKILKIKSTSEFVIEMPNYKLPLLKNIGLHVLEKTKAFVFEAGKIILAISILLWGLASFGPGNDFKNAATIVAKNNANLNTTELNAKIASFKLEHSYVGKFGKFIEPAIRPLGYDWKMGIGLITSFAAREVFVGTLATIYSVGVDDETSLMDKMRSEKRADGITPVFTFATGISLLLFYAFAMQCMSTIAIVKRETNGWKWPLIQMFVMSTFAYFVAFIAYQILK